MRVLFTSNRGEMVARKRVFSAIAFSTYRQGQLWNALVWHLPQLNAVHSVLRGQL